MSSGVLANSHGRHAFVFGEGFLLASMLRFYGLPLFGRTISAFLRDAKSSMVLNRVAGTLLLLVATSQLFSAS